MINFKPFHIKRLVEDDYNLRIDVKSRLRHLVEARHIYCLIARKHTKYTLYEIGREINRDHTSVYHSLKRADEFLKLNKKGLPIYVDFFNKFYNLENKFLELTTNNFERYLGKEDKLQNAVMTYMQMQHPTSLTIHVPNEGRRTPFERYKFKYLGGKAGVPDVLCFTPRGGYCGLAIELKVGYNKPTESQLDCLNKLEDSNWSVHWCNSFDKAKEIIDNYFDKRIDLNV